MKVEIRNDSIVIDGYVNVVDRESRLLPSPRGLFKETIVPKTFEKALSSTNNVDLLFNHNEERKLGSTSQGNLKLFEDSIGLRAITRITDEEVIRKAKNNELKGWSFGFVALEDEWREEGDIQRRFVSQLELREVSILDVTPAYIATSIETRGDNEKIVEVRTQESSSTHLFDETKNDEEATKLVLKINEILEVKHG